MGKDRNDRAGNVTAGIIMITIGVLFLTGSLGLGSIHHLWRYWPLALIAMGLGHLVLGDAEGRGQGITNLLLGVVFLAINFDWMGLSWGTGWPLILVAIGAAMMLRSMLGLQRRKRDRSGAMVVEEERHA